MILFLRDTTSSSNRRSSGISSIDLSRFFPPIPKNIDDDANKYCIEFYEKRGAATESISNKYIASGAEGNIYECSTSDPTYSNDQVPSNSALKLYFAPEGKNLTEMELIDTQLTEQGIRYPVYEWIPDKGKFEEFLGDRDTGPDFSNQQVRTATAQRLALLHTGMVENIRSETYKSQNLFEGWWNTYEVKKHFNELKIIISLPSNLTGWSGTMDDVYRMLRMDETVLNDEIQFAEETLKNYYDNNSYKAVMCHNDPHLGNIMYNKEGPFNPDELTLVDYDSAAYGFRAWDLLYNIGAWEVPITIENVDQFLEDYVVALKDPDVTFDIVNNEILHHSPYYFLEHITFLIGFGIQYQELVDAYMSFYVEAAAHFNHTVPGYSNAENNSISLLLLAAVSVVVIQLK